MALSDTSEAASKVYFQRLRAMSPAERLALAVALLTAADSLQRSVERRRNPEADEAELTFQIAFSRFGPELARKAYRKP